MAARARPTYLRTNLLVKPLGIDNNPVFSWQLSVLDGSQNITESAYCIQVATSSSFAADSLHWTSNKTPSDTASLGVEYAGDALRSSTKYYWRLCVWDQDNATSDTHWETCEVSWFETGLLHPDDWSGARWISAPHGGSAKDKKPIYLNGNFKVTGRGQSDLRGRIYATSCGWNKVFVNGVNITGAALVPRWTPFDHYTEYQCYDISEHLRLGDNRISVVVADGRFRGQLGITEGRAQYGTRLAALLLCKVFIGDDVIEFGTSSQWKSYESGSILESDPKYGEAVDQRRPSTMWLGTESDNDNTEHPTVSHCIEVQVSTKRLIAEETTRVDEITRLDCTKIWKSPSGKQLLDFGQNFTGIICIRLCGSEGSNITITYSEIIGKDGELNTKYLLPFANEDPQQDRVCLGGDETWFQPWFTIYGFRYVEVDGLDYDLDPEDVKGIVLGTVMKQTGSFKCSDPRLERLYQNTVWSARSNFTDTPTDCPTRERMGWTGDIQVFSPTASILFDSQAFIRRYLRNLATEQLPDGTIPPYIPSGVSNFSGGPKFLTKLVAQSTGWGDSSVMIPWTLYNYYGDKAILARQYDSMKLWVDSLIKRARENRNWRRWLNQSPHEDYILDTGFHWGEWLRAGEGIWLTLYHLWMTNPATSTAYLANSAHLLSQISAILDKTREAESYHAVAENVREAWKSSFVRYEGTDVRIGNDYQDDYIRALAFDLIADDQRPAALKRLIELIEEADDHLKTGFLSTPLLLPTLAKHGRIDVAYRLLLQDTVPSWLYQVDSGATTMWETWEGYDKNGNALLSHNHYALGSVAQWLQEGVAGLSAAGPGYKKTQIRPMIGGGLKHASASLETPFGLAKSAWEMLNEAGTVKLEVVIPPNTTAEVFLGQKGTKLVGSGTHTFEYSESE